MPGESIEYIQKAVQANVNHDLRFLAYLRQAAGSGLPGKLQLLGLGHSLRMRLELVCSAPQRAQKLGSVTATTTPKEYLANFKTTEIYTPQLSAQLTKAIAALNNVVSAYNQALAKTDSYAEAYDALVALETSCRNLMSDWHRFNLKSIQRETLV